MHLLPKNLLFTIASQLRLSDLNKLCVVNKKWLWICLDDSFWKFKILKDYPEFKFKKPDYLSHKKFYIRLHNAGNLYLLSEDGNRMLLSSNVNKCTASSDYVVYSDVYADLHLNMTKSFVRPIQYWGIFSKLDDSVLTKSRSKNHFLEHNVVDMVESIGGHAVLNSNANLTMYTESGAQSVLPQIVDKLGIPDYIAHYYYFIDSDLNLYLTETKLKSQDLVPELVDSNVIMASVECDNVESLFGTESFLC